MNVVSLFTDLIKGFFTSIKVGAEVFVDWLEVTVSIFEILPVISAVLGICLMVRLFSRF